MWSFEQITALRIFSCLNEHRPETSFLFLHLVQRSRTALGTRKPTQFLALSEAANSFIRVPPIVAEAENCLLCVLNQQSLFSFSCWLVSFQSIYNGEHIYKIKGGKFRACSSYRKWLRSGAMSLLQLYAAFISRESDSLLWCIGGYNWEKAGSLNLMAVCWSEYSLFEDCLILFKVGIFWKVSDVWVYFVQKPT